MDLASINKKHISLLIPSLNTGGAERVFSILANELVKKYTITLFILYEGNVSYNLNQEIELVFCKKNYVDKQTSFTSIKNHFSLIKYLKKEVKQRKSQLVLSFTTTTNVYAVLIGKSLSIPSIISERVHPDYGIGKLWKLIRKKVYPSCSKLIVQTQQIKSSFEKYIDEEKIRIIQNPIDPKLSSKVNSDIKREKIVLNIGRLTYQKNQDLLIKAFSKVSNSDWKLMLVGAGEKNEEYKKLTHELNISEKVIFTGAVSDISQYLNSASIFVLCSRFEGFPNALIEAMHFGLPCIATTCPSGPEDIISNNENGLLIPVEDESTLNKELTTLINDEKLRLTLGENAIKTTKKYNVNIILQQWDRLINSELN